MATLNTSSNLGYKPQDANGNAITVDYTPANFGANVVSVQSPTQTQKTVDATQQSATDALIVGPNQVGATGFAAPDNFLPSTVNPNPGQSVPNTPTPNAAQAASAGKSLAPEHE